MYLMLFTLKNISPFPFLDILDALLSVHLFPEETVMNFQLLSYIRHRHQCYPNIYPLNLSERKVQIFRGN